mgnify:CR=1 FL=1
MFTIAKSPAQIIKKTIVGTGLFKISKNWSKNFIPTEQSEQIPVSNEILSFIDLPIIIVTKRQTPKIIAAKILYSSLIYILLSLSFLIYLY